MTEDNAQRLSRIARIIEAVDDRCMAADGPVTPTLKEMTQAEISSIYALAKGDPQFAEGGHILEAATPQPRMNGTRYEAALFRIQALREALYDITSTHASNPDGQHATHMCALNALQVDDERAHSPRPKQTSLMENDNGND